MQQANPIHLDSSNLQTFLQKYDNFLVDCDGVLWTASNISLSGISLTCKQLLSMGKKLFYVSNNTLDSHDTFLKNIREACGYEVPPEHMFRGGRAIAYYLKQVIGLNGGKVYVVGGEGITDELDKVGVKHIGCGPDLEPVSMEREDLLKLHMDEEVQGVIATYDKHFSYNKLFKAASYQSKPECFYLVNTISEAAVQLAPGYRQPTSGAMVAAVSAASKRTPSVIGKPSRILFDCLLSEYPDLDPSRTIMVGDSMETDTVFAQTCGLDSLLVLTGVYTLQDVEEGKGRTDPNSPTALPTYITNSFADIGSIATQ